MATSTDPSEPIALTVVTALAEAKGTDVEDLDISLGEYINTDAMSALSIGPKSDWRLTFAVDDHVVIVDSEGFVTVDGNQRSIADAQ